MEYILEGYGRLQTKLWAAETLIDRTAERVSKLIHAPRENFTSKQRGEIAPRKSSCRPDLEFKGLLTVLQKSQLARPTPSR